MKTNIKKILFTAVIFTLLAIPTASAMQQINKEHRDVFFSIYSHAGKISVNAVNYGNESVNYSLIVVYGNLRILLLKELSPTMVVENGTIGPNSSFEKTCRLKFAFSPIAVVFQVDNNSLVCLGRVFGRLAIFKTTAVLDYTFNFQYF